MSVRALAALICANAESAWIAALASERLGAEVARYGN